MNLKIFFFLMQNRQLHFDFKIPYDLVATCGGEARKSLTFPFWCCILKIARTHFCAACGGPNSGQKLNPNSGLSRLPKSQKKYRVEPHFGKKN